MIKNILVSYSLLESSFLYFYMLPKYVHIYTFQPISNITRLSFYFPTPHPPKTQTLVLYDLSSSEWFIKATHITNQPKHFHVFFYLKCEFIFRAMLYGGLMESQPGISEINLQDTSAKAFEYILRYMYTGKMNLLEVKVRSE